MKNDIEDIKMLLSLMLNKQYRQLSDAEQLAMNGAIVRLGIVLTEGINRGCFENSTPIGNRRGLEL
jgi:hypothetical protein